MQAKPFVKWAGGKTQILTQLLATFPRKVHSYFEPFVGGGAVFYAMDAQKRYERAVLNDCNKELMDAYRVIRDFPDDLMTFLRELERNYAEAPLTMYETYRNPDEQLARLWAGPVQRSGRFIFLNKAGFNGLYRVNQAGQFNVPWGKKAKVRSFDERNIRACSEALNGTVAFREGDFVAAVDGAKEGDLVYFDPPYVPRTLTSSFTTYSPGGFKLHDQQRLAVLFQQLYERGVAVVLSNSDTEIVRDLYADFEMVEVQAKRAINSKGDQRGPVGELLVVSRRAARPLSYVPPA